VSAAENLFTSSDLFRTVLSVWRIASVATLLSNRWLQEPRPESPISVSDRLPWSEVRRRILRRVERARDRAAPSERLDIHIVLDRLSAGVGQAMENLEVPPDRARRFLAGFRVQVGETETSLLALLEDRATRDDPPIPMHHPRDQVRTSLSHLPEPRETQRSARASP
jgi:hypothetical protein